MNAIVEFFLLETHNDKNIVIYLFLQIAIVCTFLLYVVIYVIQNT